MIVDSISTLEPASCRAIIINVSTREVSTLAVLSALRYSTLPVLLVDLESTDGSWQHFSQLMASEPRLDLHSKPLEKHGFVLDKIFNETRDDKVLLIDSDLEILDPEIVSSMLKAISAPDTFGSGAIHGPAWLESENGFAEKVGFYQERMWIPFTVLKTPVIKRALREGYSFENRWIPNELCSVPGLAKLLSFRFFIPGLKKVRLGFLRNTRKTYHHEKPNIICCDTGADLFCYLKYNCGLQFADFGIDSLLKLVHHYHGVTRRRIQRLHMQATAIDDVFSEVMKRLEEHYGVRL
jgi:hypothetical protein